MGGAAVLSEEEEDEADALAVPDSAAGALASPGLAGAASAAAGCPVSGGASGALVVVSFCLELHAASATKVAAAATTINLERSIR
jgi:hypothetical protein